MMRFYVLLLPLLQTADSVYRSPVLVVPIKPTTNFVLPNKETSLLCLAGGNTTYRWEVNGRPVTSPAITVNRTLGVLSIANFTDREEGQYQCFAENEPFPGTKVVSVSSIVTMKTAKIDGVWPDNLLNVTSVEGEFLAMTCDNQPKSVPKPRYAWYISTEDDMEQLKTSDRIYINKEGTLQFAHVLKEDEKIPRVYKCAIYNHVLDNYKFGSRKNLLVTDVEEGITPVKPVNRYHTDPAKFLRNNDAELECFFSGYPVPNITWFDKDKKEITNNDKFEIVESSYGHKLLVKNLKEDDEGMYTCKGSNSAGTDEVSIYLNVTSGPILVNWLPIHRMMIVPEMKDAVFHCKARPALAEDPLNVPVWYKNGQLINVIGSDKFEFSDRFRTLTVKNLTKTTDMMCVQCNVSNEIGYEFGNGCLNVIDPIVITYKPPLVQRVTKGDVVNLTVTGKTDPGVILRYKWRFRNVTYMTSPPHVTYTWSTREAYINTTALSDEEFKDINGTYYRVLFHHLDQRTVAIDVITEDTDKLVGSSSSTNRCTVNLAVVIMLLCILTKHF